MLGAPNAVLQTVMAHSLVCPPTSLWAAGGLGLICPSILEPGSGPSTGEYQIILCRINGEKVKRSWSFSLKSTGPPIACSVL